MTDENIQVSASKLAFTVDGIRYQWYGGFGAVIQSHEIGVRQGQTRVIGSVIFYAYAVHGRFWKKRISWKPPGNISIDWVRKFKREVFCND